MIGISSFLIELMPLIAPLIFIANGVYKVIVHKQKRGYLFIVFASIIGIMMSVRYFHQVSNHIMLRSLTTSEVSTITVGNTQFSEDDQLQPIIGALNDKQWFSVNHSGWGDAVPLIITLQDGTTIRYRIRYYLRQEGAVIEFSRRARSGRWVDGYAFCPQLPSELKRLGAQLPSQP